MSFTKTSIKIPSATPGWNLDTWRYVPTTASSKPFPVIIMAHGLTANKLMSISEYADAFASIGYACLVFDYRRWGASDGTPRHIVLVKEQLEDYRTIIKYARQQTEFDPQRVVIWGTSFSGGHAITLASEASVNAAAAIAQCPFTGIMPRFPVNLATVKLVFLGIFDLIKRSIGLQPVYVPATAAPGKVGVLNFEGNEKGLRGLSPRESDYPNTVAASVLLQLNAYRPISKAASIVCPIVLIAPELDNLCSLAGSASIAKKAPKGELVQTPDDHFAVYPGKSQYNLSLDAQIQFLKKHVPV